MDSDVFSIGREAVSLSMKGHSCFNPLDVAAARLDQDRRPHMP